MSLVVAAEPTSLVAVEDQCAAIEAWAEACTSIAELRDAGNKLSAIDKYLELREIASAAGVLGSHWDMPPSLIGLAWWLFATIDREDAA